MDSLVSAEVFFDDSSTTWKLLIIERGEPFRHFELEGQDRLQALWEILTPEDSPRRSRLKGGAS